MPADQAPATKPEIITQSGSGAPKSDVYRRPASGPGVVPIEIERETFQRRV